MSTSHLPCPRIVLTELLSQLQQVEASSDITENPLKNVSEDTKKILLTFHVLYPNEFLPALDLLDRRLLTRFIIRTPAEEQGPSTDAKIAVDDKHQPTNPTLPTTPVTPLYFVRSAQQSRSTSTGRTYDPLATHYEVRPTSWNCGCPAFAFAAFPSSSESRDGNPSLADEVHPFGGLSKGNALPPICKHLLACVLAEHCTMFRGFAEQKEVSIEEVAGWCAGWGD